MRSDQWRLAAARGRQLAFHLTNPPYHSARHSWAPAQAEAELEAEVP